MKWRQFKQEMPKENTRLLICGIISTDPLEQCTNYMYMDFFHYDDGHIFIDDKWYKPDPGDYWIYESHIQTPYSVKENIKRI